MSPKTRRPMRVEHRIFLWMAIFFLAITPLYLYATHLHELAGSFALGLTGIFLLLVTLYLGTIAKKIDLRPEDDVDGEIYQGAGELGFFPPQSIWPLYVALTLTVTLLGAVFGWWLSIIGAAMGFWAVAGWVFEFYRGKYAH